MSEAITKEMSIGDIMQKHPASIDLMIKNGIKFGCNVNTSESLEAAARANEIDNAKIPELVEKINTKVEKEPEAARKGTLEMTENAAEKLREIMKAQKKEDHALRIGVTPGGCSGFMYSFDFDKEKKENDVVIIDKGVTIFVDSASMSALNGTRVDYVDSLQGAGFNVENPNASSSCGCGKSFH